MFCLNTTTFAVTYTVLKIYVVYIFNQQDYGEFIVAFLLKKSNVSYAKAKTLWKITIFNIVKYFDNLKHM